MPTIEKTDSHFLQLASDAEWQEFLRLDRLKIWRKTTIDQRLCYGRYIRLMKQTELAQLVGIAQTAIANAELDIKDPRYFMEMVVALRVWCGYARAWGLIR